MSNQIVQRDRYAHFVLTLALIAASLEKFATEIRSLQRTELHELEEPFGQGQTGSSSMPHKRNPELAERICAWLAWSAAIALPRWRTSPSGGTRYQSLLCRKNYLAGLLPGP